MDLDEIAFFVRVVREGSLAAAARSIGVPKSTVSRNVTRLEERLGIRLVERSNRRVTPTAEGAELYGRCSRIVLEAEDALRSITVAGKEPSGTLRLTAPRQFENFLGGVIEEYVRRWPNVRAEVLLTDRMVDLLDERLDLAVRVGRLPEGALVARQFSRSQIVHCASPAYLEKRGIPTHPEQVRAHDCITTGELAGPKEWVFTGLTPPTVAVLGRVHAATFALALTLCLRGVGIARVPLFLCAEHVRAGRLSLVLRGFEPPPTKFWLVYPSGRHLAARVRVFIDLLQKHARRAPWETESLAATVNQTT